MHFALIDNKQVEASPKLKGVCPCCLQPVIAKCGNQKIWHWAHRNNFACDTWWEPETEWHRTWKNNYPDEWQEIILPDERTGEKHIADIRTPHGLVIEFQHSHIDPQERTSREKFYQNMVWVVDGTRLKRDYPRFCKGVRDFRKSNRQGVFYVDFPDKVFPFNWLESAVPVFFDFRGLSFPDAPIDPLRNILWCLLPKQINNHAVVVGIDRKVFIKWTHERAQLFHEKSKEQMQRPQTQPQLQVRRKEPTHYYDPHKKMFVKRERF